ncbi:hypothetical protein ACIQXI_14280 [Lysinibacillus sp. NPDC097195]|uniref:hypothetical protein n=1 Tax=Lysinibacillus sp. NPDC097195 TaxID=3364141 RepID=UPI0038225D87
MRIDLTGQRFGALVVIRAVGKDKDGSIIWECICDCDLSKPCEVNGVKLRNRNKVNCGCIHGNSADLIGERFGKLLVIGFKRDTVKGILLWICHCDCGEKTIVKTRDLTSGSKSSCGCLKSPNLNGQRFGRLIVLEKLSKKKNGYYLWKCICDCGNSVEVNTQDLNGDRKKSCGCLEGEYEDLTGTKWNRLTVIKLAEHRGSKDELLWECKCECGEISFVPRDKLLSGHTKSCGCLKKEHRAEKHSNWKEGVTPISKKFRRAIKPWIQASLENYDFKCFISGKGGKLVVHHSNEKHPFYKILEETFEVLGFEIKPNIGDFTLQQIELLEKKCIELHFKYGLGVPLDKELHEEFHETYGFVSWTEEDFKIFVESKRKVLL